jgi:RNA polymerase sigma-54 factor
MKTALQLKMGQQLTMTPQLQQAIRLLQLSTLDLQQEIQSALESNPLLEAEEPNTNEEEEAAEWSQEASLENWSLGSTSSSSGGGAHTSEDGETSDWMANATEEADLQDHLLWQLNLTTLSPLDYIIGSVIIESVDNSGYLSDSKEELTQAANALAKEHPQIVLEESLKVEDIDPILHLIQHFDPVGVAAVDLQETLQIQALTLAPETPYRDEALFIINDYLELLAHKDFAALARKTKLKEPELCEALNLIRMLNPRPGNQIGKNQAEYIVPDVIVRKINDEWRVDLNPDLSQNLRINESYASLAREASKREDAHFIKDHLQEAKWFIKSLQSRNETLLKVSREIVSVQEGFFDHGEEAMKPLVLHDIAEAVSMHESTISRVTTQKYMMTPKGIFELKYFFSSHVNTYSGGECSSTAIRAMIRKLIANENARKPLSDNKIATLLGEQGINVARRTIAKYREAMHIPPSNERKQLI